MSLEKPNANEETLEVARLVKCRPEALPEGSRLNEVAWVSVPFWWSCFCSF